MARGTAIFDKRTLRERCTDYVRDLVISGQMKPGDHLIETRLADELGVSRGTLREAVRPLQNEGLLVDDGRGHLLVREMTPDEIREVFQVRAALETLAASLLAERDDRDDLADQLQAAIRPLEDSELEFGEQIRVDLGFHETMCRLTGNSTLVRSWRQLIGQIEMTIIAVGSARGSLRMRYEDHIPIVEAIASGDVGKVRRVVSAHFDQFATQYLLDHGATPDARAGGAES